MQIVFVSNYINHHQIPFCEEMIKLCGDEHTFLFIQTEEISQERMNMGWQTEIPSYVLLAYASDEENAKCRKLILDSEVVIFGGCEDESYITPRLEETLENHEKEDYKKITFRYSERLYKEALWKWVSPRGLKEKRQRHTRYKDCPVYLLCAGGYVASDYAKFGAYPEKKYKWGYFPKNKKYDIDELITQKGWTNNDNKKIPYLLWTGRLLDWKHPELAIETARYLKERGYDFHMDIIGGGPEEENVKRLYEKYNLSDKVSLMGFKSPNEIRSLMEKADIYLFTSDRNEGWGAVCNEAMNSGCTVVADNMIGAVPYLIVDSKNGYVYDDGNKAELFFKVEEAICDAGLRHRIGAGAYKTIDTVWNAEVSSKNLYELIISKLRSSEILDRECTDIESGPCSKDDSTSERKIRNKLLR